MSATQTVFTNAKLAYGTLKDIVVQDGRITAIGETSSSQGVKDVVDIGGALIVPSFVEGHIHLDTSFYGDRWIPHKPWANIKAAMMPVRSLPAVQ